LLFHDSIRFLSNTIFGTPLLKNFGMNMYLEWMKNAYLLSGDFKYAAFVYQSGRLITMYFDGSPDILTLLTCF